MIIIRNRLPTFEEIDKLIQQSLMDNPFVEDTVQEILFDIKNKNKYRHLIKLDAEKELDERKKIYDMIERVAHQHAFDEYIKAIDEIRVKWKLKSK